MDDATWKAVQEAEHETSRLASLIAAYAEAQLAQRRGSGGDAYSAILERTIDQYSASKRRWHDLIDGVEH